jgi:hypothetical protein
MIEPSDEALRVAMDVWSEQGLDAAVRAAFAVDFPTAKIDTETICCPWCGHSKQKIRDAPSLHVLFCSSRPRRTEGDDGWLGRGQVRG